MNETLLWFLMLLGVIAGTLTCALFFVALLAWGISTVFGKEQQ